MIAKLAIEYPLILMGIGLLAIAASLFEIAAAIRSLKEK